MLTWLRYTGRPRFGMTSRTIRVRIVEISRFSQNQDKMQKNENLTVFEAVAADAVSYADAVLEDLDKKK